MFTNSRRPHLCTVLHEGRYLPYKTKYISGKTDFAKFMLEIKLRKKVVLQSRPDNANSRHCMLVCEWRKVSLVTMTSD